MYTYCSSTRCCVIPRSIKGLIQAQKLPVNGWVSYHYNKSRGSAPLGERMPDNRDSAHRRILANYFGSLGLKCLCKVKDSD